MLNARATGTSLEIFLRTLLTSGREALASYVRTLRFEWEDMKLDSAHWSTFSTPRQESQLTASELPTSQGRQLMLLLNPLPRLQFLQFSLPYYRHTLRRFLESAGNNGAIPCGLKSLREILCPLTDDSNGVHHRTFKVFSKLPQIRHIEVANIIKFYFLDIPVAGSAPSSTLTHLRFTHAGIPNWVLSGILRVPNALTHFSYSMVLNSGFHLSGFMAHSRRCGCRYSSCI